MARRRLASGASLGLLAALALGLAFRVYPAIATGMPFQMVTWAQLYNVDVLRAHPQARLYSDPRFDGYNNRWPGSIVAVKVYTMVTGPEGPLASYIPGPLAEGLALIPFHALASRVAGRRNAWIATLALALAPSMIAMGGGLTKEGMARPVFYSLLLASTGGLGAASAPLAVGVAVYHHLTGAAALLVLGLSYTLAWAMGLLSRGSPRAPDPRSAALVALAVPSYLLLAAPGYWRRGVLGAIDPVGLALYVVAFASLPVLAMAYSTGGSGLRAYRDGVAPLALILAGLVLISRRGLSPGVQPLGPDLMVYASPLLASPLLVVHAVWRHRVGGGAWHVLPYAWAFGLTGAALYLAFAGSPLGGSAVGRVLNLALPGYLLLYASSGSRLARLLSPALVLAALVFTLRILSGADTVNFNLVYHAWEAEALKLAGLYGHQVVGDAKVYYLGQYMGVDVALPNPASEPGGLLVLYRENLRWGYRLHGNLLAGDPGSIAGHLTGGELLYNSGASWLALP